MIETIGKVINLFDTVIVIAGIAHFIPQSEHEGDKRFSLEPLYSYLDTIPSVVMKQPENEECVIM